MGSVWGAAEVLRGSTVPTHLVAIDACMNGWIAGVTAHLNEKDPSQPLRGLHFLDGYEGSPAQGTCDVLRISLADVAELATIGHPPGELDRGAGTYTTRITGTTYDLHELLRAEMAWKLRDPDTEALMRFKHVELRSLHADLMDFAARLLENLLGLFKKLRDQKARWVWTVSGRTYLLPPVYVEGGLHLASRCVAEAARAFCFPVYALENTWLPNRIILSPETGAAVNRFALLYDRARAIVPSDLDLYEEDVLQELAVKGDLAWYRRAYPWLYSTEISEEEKLEQELGESVKLTAAFAHPEIPTICFLGQVPYDASVTMDNPNGVTPTGIFRKLAEKTNGQVVFIYRSHPMEEASRITGLTESDRLTAAQEDLGGRLVLIDGGRLPLLHHLELAGEGFEPSIWATVNSQAGLEVARFFDVEVSGRAFYEAAGVTSRFGGIRLDRIDAEERRRRWLRYVAWLLSRVYVDRRELTADRLQIETSRYMSHGFEVHDWQRGRP